MRAGKQQDTKKVDVILPNQYQRNKKEAGSYHASELGPIKAHQSYRTLPRFSSLQGPSLSVC